MSSFVSVAGSRRNCVEVALLKQPVERLQRKRFVQGAKQANIVRFAKGTACIKQTVARTRHEDHGCLRLAWTLCQHQQCLDTIEIGHVNIKQDEVRRELFQQRGKIRLFVSRPRLITPHAQCFRTFLGEIIIIIENHCAHFSALLRNEGLTGMRTTIICGLTNQRRRVALRAMNDHVHFAKRHAERRKNRIKNRVERRENAEDQREEPGGNTADQGGE